MKIRDETPLRVKEKLNNLKSRLGHKKFMSDILYPSRKKAEDKLVIAQYIPMFEEKIKKLEPIVKLMKNHIDYIGDPDKFVAAYLLIGKSFLSLKAILRLTEEGYSYQSVELVRSSIESLYLAATFLEEGQGENIKEWFEGKIIGNAIARDALHGAVNTLNQGGMKKVIPFKDALKDTYSIYSGYTHSGYAAIFDYIDVFREDFDFEQCAQLHYSRRNISLISNLYFNILLGLKNFYARAKDEENLLKVEELINQEGGALASPEEIAKEMSRYQ